jgi:hypothetical protein
VTVSSRRPIKDRGQKDPVAEHFRRSCETLSRAASGLMRPFCDHCMAVPADETPLIQQIHIVAAHSICGLVERALFPRTK